MYSEFSMQNFKVSAFNYEQSGDGYVTMRWNYIKAHIIILVFVIITDYI